MVTKPWYVKKNQFHPKKNRVFHLPSVTRDWLARVKKNQIRSSSVRSRVERSKRRARRVGEAVQEEVGHRRGYAAGGGCQVSSGEDPSAAVARLFSRRRAAGEAMRQEAGRWHGYA
jgi:hypothetical protein